MDIHRECSLLTSQPYGQTPRCADPHLKNLSALISQCQLYIPSFSIAGLSILNVELGQPSKVALLPGLLTWEFYRNLQLELSRLRSAAATFQCLPDIKRHLHHCLVQHNILPSHTVIPTILDNLDRWCLFVLETKSHTESVLFQMLDAHPNQTSEILDETMKLVACLYNLQCSVILTQLQVKRNKQSALQRFSFRDFQTLGVGRWLNDEIINYFVHKWCSESDTTLGLNSWFASKFLFEEDLCIHAKQRLTAENEKGVRRWCRAAEVRDASLPC